MAFSVGGSDVVAGIRLAIKIYELGFVEENAAGQSNRKYFPRTTAHILTHDRCSIQKLSKRRAEL